MEASELTEAVSADMPRIRAELERLVRIPSIGFPDYDPANLRASAVATAAVLKTAGLQGVRLIEIPDGHPAVFGEVAGPSGTPTVLLYAHHDVQPEGSANEWASPPFEPEERNGRLFGRGTSDDKCGIVMHAAALRAFGGKPPVGVKVIVEGEEECDADHLDFLIGEHIEMLRAGAVVIADSGVWRRGTPALTTSIRGVVACTVEVRTLDKALHSGVYGGPVPDAIMALARMIASLHDAQGNVTVPGLVRGSVPAGAAPEIAEDDFRQEAGVRPGVERLGSGPLADQLWQGPSISVIGMDVPSIREASYQIVPVARAAVTMRIAPRQDPGPALDALVRHLEASAPWGVEVKVESESHGIGFETPQGGRAYEAARRSLADAWGVEPVDMGMGGSVPLVPLLAQAMPGAEVLLTGPGDELSAAHSLDESVDLEELRRACVAEALFLHHMNE